MNEWSLESSSSWLFQNKITIIVDDTTYTLYKRKEGLTGYCASELTELEILIMYPV
jgi:hypothetical protein